MRRLPRLTDEAATYEMISDANMLYMARLRSSTDSSNSQAEILLGSRPKFAGRSLHQWTGTKTSLASLLTAIVGKLSNIQLQQLLISTVLRHAHDDLPWLTEQNVVGTFEAASPAKEMHHHQRQRERERKRERHRDNIAETVGL